MGLQTNRLLLHGLLKLLPDQMVQLVYLVQKEL